MDAHIIGIIMIMIIIILLKRFMVMDEVDFKALWDKSFFDHCIFQFICMKINTV